MVYIVVHKRVDNILLYTRSWVHTEISIDSSKVALMDHRKLILVHGIFDGYDLVPSRYAYAKSDLSIYLAR
jgi:hypothetical protein